MNAKRIGRYAILVFPALLMVFSIGFFTTQNRHTTDGDMKPGRAMKLNGKLGKLDNNQGTFAVEHWFGRIPFILSPEGKVFVDHVQMTLADLKNDDVATVHYRAGDGGTNAAIRVEIQAQFADGLIERMDAGAGSLVLDGILLFPGKNAQWFVLGHPVSFDYFRKGDRLSVRYFTMPSGTNVVFSADSPSLRVCNGTLTKMDQSNRVFAVIGEMMSAEKTFMLNNTERAAGQSNRLMHFKVGDYVSVNYLAETNGTALAIDVIKKDVSPD